MKEKYLLKTRRHFLFLAIIPSVIFMGVVMLSLSWMQEIHLTNAVQANLNSVYNMFYGELYEEAKLINVLAVQLSEKKEIQDVFLAKDRERLLEIVRPVFLKIRADYDISNLYFHSLDKTNFLRAYAPNHHGDIITRFTLQEAERTGSVSYGLELGKLEGLILRVVVPWRIKDRIVGYIELAKDIGKVTQELKKILDIDLVLIVDKSLLNKAQWEKAMEKGAVASEWAQFPDSVVVSKTMTALPPIIDKDLSLPHQQHQDTLLRINHAGRQYIAGFAPLLDASDKDIGDIIIIKDFTEIKTVGNRIHSYLLIGYLVFVLIYLLAVFIYLRHVKLGLKKLIGTETTASTET